MIKKLKALIDKEIKDKFETNNPTKQLIRKCKRNGSELIIYRKFVYTHEDIIIPIIMHCIVSTQKAIEFSHKLRFKQYDIMLTKEQSVLRSAMVDFEGESVQTQYSVLGYKIDLYFSDYRLAIEVDEKNHYDRDFNKK